MDSIGRRIGTRRYASDPPTYSRRESRSWLSTKPPHDLKVKESEDKSLAQLCFDIRRARRGKGKTKLNEERIASLDALGLIGRQKEGESEGRGISGEGRRVESVQSRARTHHVKKSKDKSLAQFCWHIRRARRNPGRRKGRQLTEERIASLNALGFDWTRKSGPK